MSVKSTYPKCPAIQAALAALAGKKATLHKEIRKVKRKKGSEDELKVLRERYQALQAAYIEARRDAIGL